MVDVVQTDVKVVLAVQDDGHFTFIDPTTFNSVSHIGLPGLAQSSKARLAQRGGHLAIAEDNGLVFMKYGIGGASLPTMTSLEERYLKGKVVTDFVEYERDKFFVSVLRDDYFYLVTRFGDASQMGKIRSMNKGYITMGLQPLPRAGQTFLLVRDNRGVQLVNLETQRSHQLMLSPGPGAFQDLKFLSVTCEEGRGGAAYSVATLFEEPDPSKSDAGPPEAQLCLYTIPPEFTNGLKSYCNNLMHSKLTF